MRVSVSKRGSSHAWSTHMDPDLLTWRMGRWQAVKGQQLKLSSLSKPLWRSNGQAGAFEENIAFVAYKARTFPLRIQPKTMSLFFIPHCSMPRFNPSLLGHVLAVPCRLKLSMIEWVRARHLSSNTTSTPCLHDSE